MVCLIHCCFGNEEWVLLIIISEIFGIVFTQFNGIHCKFSTEEIYVYVYFYTRYKIYGKFRKILNLCMEAVLLRFTFSC